MSKINVTKWEEFKVGDIINFNSSMKIYHAEYLDILDKPADSNYHPYVVRSAFNNGIRGYIREDPNTLNPANTISFAQDTAQLFYQSEPYFTGNKIKICTVNGVTLNKNIALFLITALLKGFSTFNYDSSFNITNLSRVNIKLPVNSIGQPDWNYMGAYIDKLATQAHQNLSSLRKLKPQEHAIDVHKWKKFHLYDLFDINSGSKLDRKDVMLFTGNDYNYIGRTGDNNGIIGHCGYIDIKGKQPYPAGNLTVALGGTVGATFVQTKPFYTSQNVDVLSPLYNMSNNIKMFIATCIYKESQLNYSAFIKELNAHIKKDFYIKLPVDSNNQPDWQYMDKYINKIVIQAHKNLNSLRKFKP